MEQRAGGSPSVKSRVIAVAVAAAILAWPIGYLVLRLRDSQHVSAQNIAPPPPGMSIAQLEAAVRANPSVSSRIALSVAYINGNRADRAIPLLESIVVEDANNAIAWNNLCVAHTLQMEYNIALEDCNRAIRIAPGFQLAHNNLKWAEDENRKAVAAIAAQEQIAPANRGADSYLGEGLNNLHIGNYDQAIKAWQRALELNPGNAPAANNIGIAYMYKKQPAIALPWFAKAIAMDPTLQIARNNLAWAKEERAKANK